MKKLLVLMGLLFSTCLYAHNGEEHSMDRQAMWQKMLQRTPIAAGVAFDKDGTLWQASVLAGRLRVQFSKDFGATFSDPIAVNSEEEIIAANGENRPQIAFSQGLIVVAWAQSLPDVPFTGNVRFSVSGDQGKSWSAPANINDDRLPAGHSFVSFIQTGENIQAVWLDGRLRAKNPSFKGSAVFTAQFIPAKQSFGKNRKLAEHSCECCQITTAQDNKGNTFALWRHIFKDNIRDHALINLNGKEAPVRVTFNNWKIEACPHHGPSLAIDSKNTKHMVWFNQDSKDAHVLFYGQMKTSDSKPSKVLGVGNTDNQTSYPAVISTEKRLVLAWTEFDGETTHVMSMESKDFGQTFSAPKSLMKSDKEQARPILLAFNERVFLAWHGPETGLNVVEIQ